MPLYLLDTNALSRCIGNRHAGLAEKVYQHRTECVLSCISWFELEYGRQRSPDPIRTGVRLSLLRTFFVDALPFGEREAERAAWVRGHLAVIKPSPLHIGPYDVLLASHALSLGAILITNNTREFSRVPGLEIEDWQAT